MKKNCWEFKNCGSEHICPSASETRLDGVHTGKNGGRSCWVIAKTLCGDKIDGTFLEKFKDCAICDFHRKVRVEEGAGFQFTFQLLKRLKV
ncbi:MAG: two-CW domain-containing protein [Nitrospirota bacterium]